MLGLRINDLRSMSIEEMPKPAPAPDEVLVEIQAAGICGTDLEVLHGLQETYRSGRAHLPIVPGHEWSGVVREVGAEVTRFQPGDFVTGETGLGCLRCEVCLTGHHQICPDLVETGIANRDGGMRQFHVHPEVATHLAEGLTPEQAATVEPLTVAVHACRKGRVGLGARVAVLGCGPIGLLAIQAARAAGARSVLATSRSRPKLDKAVGFGADLALDVAHEDLYAAADEMTGGTGFDVVLECSGSLDAVNQAIDIAGRCARIVLVGVYRGEPFGHELDRFLSKELEMYGSCGGPHAWPEAIDLIRDGRVRVEPIISHRFPLTDFAEAFALAEKGGPDVLKIMLFPPEA